jgi:hypothetical protein
VTAEVSDRLAVVRGMLAGASEGALRQSAAAAVRAAGELLDASRRRPGTLRLDGQVKGALFVLEALAAQLEASP